MIVCHDKGYTKSSLVIAIRSVQSNREVGNGDLWSHCFRGITNDKEGKV
jgi:hypothetical protein